MIKVIEKLGLGRSHLSTTKAIYDKPTASIMLGKLKPFLLIWDQDRVTLLLFNALLKNLARAIRQENKIRCE